MSPDAPPIDLDLKRDERLVVTWADGDSTTYPLAYLRQHCPCAACRDLRQSAAAASASRGPGRPASRRLTVLPSNFAAADAAVTVASAELVGNYALRLEWSDGHGTGIYSFAYLHEIASGVRGP